jgi:hypothetical protein
MRRIVLIGILLALWASPAQAAWAKVGTGQCVIGDGNAAGINGMNTSGADFLVAVTSWHAGVSEPSTPMDDSINGTSGWQTGLTTYTGGGARVKIYYNSSSGNSNHNFTYTVSGGYPSLCVIAFSGSHASPFDTGKESGGANGTMQLGNPTLPGALTSSVANALFISVLGGVDDPVTYTIPTSGWTKEAQVNFSSGVAFGVAIGYKIESGGPTSTNPSWEMPSGGNNATVAMAVFIPSSGGGGGGTANGLLLLGCCGQ